MRCDAVEEYLYSIGHKALTIRESPFGSIPRQREQVKLLPNSRHLAIIMINDAQRLLKAIFDQDMRFKATLWTKDESYYDTNK